MNDPLETLREKSLSFAEKLKEEIHREPDELSDLTNERCHAGALLIEKLVASLTQALAEKDKKDEMINGYHQEIQVYVKRVMNLEATLAKVVEAGMIRIHAGYHVAGGKWVSCTDEGMCGCGMDQHNTTLQRLSKGEGE